jgi:hypothetical protein
MAPKIATMVTLNSITVNYDGETHIVRRDDAAYEKVKLALKEKRFEDIPALMSPAKHVEQASGGLFQVVDGEVYVENVKVPPMLGKKIVGFRDEGLPFEPLVAFARKLNNNPSFRSVQQLFAFLEANDHPITEEGNFIAYKSVSRCSDGVLRDTRTKTIVNEPGSVCEMPRNQVDEDPNRTCSFGLHIANWDYAQNHYGGYADPMLEVEVDPADVVAVPVDYNQSKMRVCRYKVRAVVSNPNANRNLVRDYIEEESSESSAPKALAVCNNCGGSGENPDAEGNCPDCEGTGKIGMTGSHVSHDEDFDDDEPDYWDDEDEDLDEEE